MKNEIFDVLFISQNVSKYHQKYVWTNLSYLCAHTTNSFKRHNVNFWKCIFIIKINLYKIRLNLNRFKQILYFILNSVNKLASNRDSVSNQKTIPFKNQFNFCKIWPHNQSYLRIHNQQHQFRKSKYTFTNTSDQRTDRPEQTKQIFPIQPSHCLLRTYDI